ncbi:hypothetical protein HZC07_01060 [Candidatus Micrarchaeota archaeon]|nr:hypothetical protein [Candidatus Micrarchaeota archaeon]
MSKTRKINCSEFSSSFISNRVVSYDFNVIGISVLRMGRIFYIPIHRVSVSDRKAAFQTAIAEIGDLTPTDGVFADKNGALARIAAHIKEQSVRSGSGLFEQAYRDLCPNCPQAPYHTISSLPYPFAFTASDARGIHARSHLTAGEIATVKKVMFEGKLLVPINPLTLAVVQTAIYRELGSKAIFCLFGGTLSGQTPPTQVFFPHVLFADGHPSMSKTITYLRDGVGLAVTSLTFFDSDALQTLLLLKVMLEKHDRVLQDAVGRDPYKPTEFTERTAVIGHLLHRARTLWRDGVDRLSQGDSSVPFDCLSSTLVYDSNLFTASSDIGAAVKVFRNRLSASVVPVSSDDASRRFRAYSHALDEIKSHNHPAESCGLDV